jgi:hypothetical protein
VNLRDAANALYERLQHDLGDKAFSRQMFEALNLSGKQMAFILAHQELFNEAIVATIREAQRKQNAYINSMSNATDQIVYDQVGSALMAGGFWAAGKLVKYAGGLIEKFRDARKAKQLDKAAEASKALSAAADDVAFGLNRAEREALAAHRPERYRKGVATRVWENAKDANGKVFDPNTGEELRWDPSRSRDGQWDMGHVKGKSYDQLRKDFIEGRISRQQFLDEYNNPANYRPEARSPNRSRRYD